MNIVNSIVEEYTDGYYSPFTNELGILRKEAEKDRVPIILKGTETALAPLLLMKQPKKILEIGTAVGYSSSFFASVCKVADVVTIERDEIAHAKAINNIKKLGLSNQIECILGDANEILESLTLKVKNEEISPFDFIFIDAAKSHYMKFWEYSMKLSKEGTVIVCDNVLLKGATASDEYDPKRRHKTNIKNMRNFIDFVMELDVVDTFILPVGDGLTISIVKGNI